MKTKKIVHVLLALIFVAATVIAGCAQTTTRTSIQTDQSNWEWVPRVWVEDNSFTGGQYDRCTFDESTFGYWCPPGTR